MACSCLGSQGKLQVVIHIPLGSDSGSKGIEILEIWTQPRCVEQISFPGGVLEKEVEFLKSKDRKGGWYLRLRMRPSRRQGFDNLRPRQAGVSRRGAEATSVKFCSDPCRTNRNHTSVSFSGLSPLLFQSPYYPRPDWNKCSEMNYLMCSNLRSLHANAGSRLG